MRGLWPKLRNSLAKCPVAPYHKFSVGRRVMPTYRLYKLDLSGKFESSVDMQAADDDAALDAVRAFKHPCVCELWLARRLIGRVSAA